MQNKARKSSADKDGNVGTAEDTTAQKTSSSEGAVKKVTVVVKPQTKVVSVGLSFGFGGVQRPLEILFFGSEYNACECMYEII